MPSSELKSLSKQIHSSQPVSPFQVVLSPYDANEQIKTCTPRKGKTGGANYVAIDLPTDLIQHRKELRFVWRIIKPVGA